MRLFVRYAGGLACLVTALALVACGGGPGSPPEPKQIGNIAFQQGEKVRTIPLSDKFSGADLTYSATTSKRSVATVTVDNDADTLTVTAVAAGTATITVTAENSQGEAKQTFTVTVPKPPAPDPVEIPDIPSLEEGASSRPIPLGDKFSGENLTYATSSNNRSVATATVDNDADTLTVTAVSAGTATITVTATAQGSATQTQTQTFTVTVPQPAAEVTVPTVKASATTAESVAVRATSTVLLSTVFDGATSYRAESRPNTIATASGASSGTLRITGVSAGSATITVTGTNTAGSTAHPIAVTVTPPDTTPPTTATPDPQPSTTCSFPQTTKLTIERTDHIKCTLPKGYYLNEPPGEVLTLDQRPDGETPNVWLIQADKKGTHTITVFNEARKREGTITVTVPNTPPVRVPGEQGEQHPDAQTITDPRPDNILGDIRIYFTDEDTEDYTDSANNNLRYRVQTKPDWVLVESTDEGFVRLSGTGQIMLEVLEPMGKEGEEKEFPVSIYAVDNSGDESNRPVRIVVKVAATGIDPRPGEYSAQQLSNGALHRDSALDVGPRFLRDTGAAVHTLTFNRVENGPGFSFSDNYVEGLIDEKKLSGASQDITNEALFIYKDRDNNNRPSLPIPEWDSTTSLGLDYYLLESSGDVKAKWPTALASTDDSDVNTISAAPEIEFKLTGRGSGTIRISYHVVALASKSEADPFPIDGGRKMSALVRTLTLRIVTCESPPNKLENCPGYTTG